MFANPQDDYNLRIIDFGLAEQLEEDSEHVIMKMCGTLEYMSPEVMDCKHASRASGEKMYCWDSAEHSSLLFHGTADNQTSTNTFSSSEIVDF